MFSFMQRPKEHVRAGIVHAAARLFAEVGYEKATMADVAERGGTSIGNVYKYFPNKAELFDAVLPASFVRELEERTHARMRALGPARDVRELPADAPYRGLAEDLLTYGLAHRERLIILLDRAEKTPFASFADAFTKRLVASALAYGERAWPRVEPTPTLRFCLTRIYRSYLAGIAAALQSSKSAATIRRAIDQLTAYHLGGLKHLFETLDAARGASR